MKRAGNEKIGNQLLNLPVKAGTVITEATMIAIAADGYAIPAEAATGLLVAGAAQNFCDNRNGTDGAETVSVKRGTFVWDNDGTIAVTDLLKKCYIKNSTTVTITPEASSIAGTILAVEADGVTVDMTQV